MQRRIFRQGSSFRQAEKIMQRQDIYVAELPWILLAKIKTYGETEKWKRKKAMQYIHTYWKMAQW